MPKSGKGQILVANRRGDSLLWPGICAEQIVRLEPLYDTESMAVLWIWSKSKHREGWIDEVVLDEVNNGELEEHRALQNLVAIPAGLPLALEQATAFRLQSTLVCLRKRKKIGLWIKFVGKQ